MIEITVAKYTDVNDIARLHWKVFQGFFLTSLGHGFLCELYAGFLTQPYGILLIASDGGIIVGFAAGTTNSEEFFPKLRRRRGLFFLMKAIPSVLMNPVPVCKKLISAFFYRGDPPVAGESGALLSSIGVAANYRGKALADRLLAGFEQKASEQGIMKVYLTTDAVNNDRVNSFYQKNGYFVECNFMQSGGRPMYRYIKDIGLKNNNYE